MKKSTWTVSATCNVKRNSTYFVNGICLIIVNNSDLASIRELNHLRVFNVNDVFDRQRNLDTVTIIVASKYDSLEALNPFFGTWSAVSPEVIRAIAGDH